MASIAVVEAINVPVWRVGRAPDPWAWVERQYSGHNRWDDAASLFRTVHASDSLYACYVEVLAYARPDLGPGGKGILDAIEEDPEDAAAFPTPAAGSVPRQWVAARMVGAASLFGICADMRAANTIAALRPRFVTLALRLGYPDFDAAALKSSHPRELTQRVSSYLYALGDETDEARIDGVRFASRHGDELTMWAIFERPGDGATSRHLHDVSARPVVLDEPDLVRAMSLHGLGWG